MTSSSPCPMSQSILSRSDVRTGFIPLSIFRPFLVFIYNHFKFIYNRFKAICNQADSRVYRAVTGLKSLITRFTSSQTAFVAHTAMSWNMSLPSWEAIYARTASPEAIAPYV